MTKSDGSDDPGPRPLKPHEPTFVRSGVFTHDGEYFRAHGLRKGDPDRLWERLREYSNRSELERDLMMSQFEHCGIPYDANATREDLLKHFEVRFREGKFNSVPSHVNAIRETLEEDWKASYAAYERDKELYEDRLAQWNVKSFGTQRTLREQAIFDQDLFIKTYYLNSHGEPSRAKLPGLLTLEEMPYGWPSGLQRWSSDLSHSEDRVPGLSVASYYWRVYNDGYATCHKPGTVWIGWDSAEVERAREEFHAKLEARRKKKRNREHAERYNAHLRYISRPEAEPATVAGHYILRWPELEALDEMDFRNGVSLSIWQSKSLPDGIFEGSLDLLERFQNEKFQGEFLLSADLDLLKSYFGTGQRQMSGELGRWDRSDSGPGKRGEDSGPYKAQEGGREVPLLYHTAWTRASYGEEESHQEWSLEVDGPDWTPFDESFPRLDCDGVHFDGRLSFEDQSLTRFGAVMVIPFVMGMSFFGGGEVDPLSLVYRRQIDNTYHLSSDDEGSGGSSVEDGSSETDEYD